ncbi:DNA polymerase III subunit beta [Thermococcus celericrescens]|uniref:protein adenylyltransferase n=1 Tax=Thermococcus celericrescens TaxID=227598 RepID=A0A117ITW8_9EURY|nr:nucleotidyltransferase family protein [Thermococcus celericrescens]KUH34217.1 DNA polymerase III subunit beta [Thermococcus celericrescens]
MQATRVKTLVDVQKILRAHRKELSEKYCVKRIGVFGSYSRNEQREDSDVDIFVEFERPVRMITFLRLQEYLEELLGVKVDLVTKGALKRRIRERILKEVKYV